MALAQKSDNAISMATVPPDATTIASRSQNSTSSTANGSNSFQTYENPTYGIIMHYPSNWTLSQTGLRDHTNIVAFYSPLENLSDAFSEHVLLSITHYAQNITLSDYSNLINATVKQPGVQIVESKAITLAGGHPAQTIVFMPASSAAVNTGLLKPEVMLVWTIEGNKVYTMSYNAEAAEYSKYLPIVQKMIESFEITR